MSHGASKYTIVSIYVTNLYMREDLSEPINDLEFQRIKKNLHQGKSPAFVVHEDELCDFKIACMCLKMGG